MDIIIILLLLSPIAIEVYADKLFWNAGLNDKPWSTLIRLVMFLASSFLMVEAGADSVWQSFILAFAVHFLLFDYVINLVRGKNFFYVSNSNHWYENLRRHVPFYGELFGKLWFLSVAYGVYAHLDLII